MYGVMMRPKTKQETCAEENDSFHDKRRLLSYWKSLESPTCAVSNEIGNDTNQTGNDTNETGKDIKNELLVELKKCLAELDDLDSSSSVTEQNASFLQSEQLNLLKQLEEYSAYFTRESSVDLKDDLKGNKEVLEALRAERALLLEENEKLVNKMEKQKKEHKFSSGEQQKDIEKLTREVQNINISKRKLERELHQRTKQKNENEATISSLRNDMKVIKETYEAEIQKLNTMNEQVSQEKNVSELVEKGKEATESLKIAFHQLTEEKKAMLGQKKSNSGKDIREIETSLERVKKEREAFRQRCEKSEIVQRSLQEEITSLKKELEVKEVELARGSFREVVDGRNSSPVDQDGGLQRANSRISQLKQYVHVLEDRLKEKDQNTLSLRKENAKANDVAMEKSLELSRTRRILERKIEKLTNENSELKRKFVIPNSNSIKSETESKQDIPKRNFKQRQRDIEERRQRRRSNPERWEIESTLKRLRNEKSSPELHNGTSNGTISKLSEKQIEKPDDQALGTSTSNIPQDVAPRRRIGGKFIRATSKRHSADLGKLMSRPEPVINKRLDSDMLLEDESATIFANKYLKKNEEEQEHWV